MSRIARSTATLLTALVIVASACGDNQTTDNEVGGLAITRVSHWDRLPPEYDLIGPWVSRAEVSIEKALAHEFEPGETISRGSGTSATALPVR